MSDITERIAAARKEVESIKDKIKAKKELLADTTCKNHSTREIIATERKESNVCKGSKGAIRMHKEKKEIEL